MKVGQKTSLLFVFLLLTTMVYAQPFGHWRVLGNPTIGIDAVTAGSNFLGTDGTNNIPIRLGTFGFTRMFIQDNTGPTAGFIGIGTIAPPFHLSLDNDGGILALGTTASGALVPAGLTGSRMIWCPSLAAFRAGEVLGAEWDNANIGRWSAAFGLGTTASADGSFAAGDGTVASGGSASAFGQGTTASGDGSFAIGRQFVFASGNISFAGGATVSATNTGDFVFGETSLATGGFSTCFGADAQANGQLSYAFGSFIRANATNSYVFGDGLAANPLVNAIPNSLMVGFQSDVPTFYVGVAGGTIGSLGNVGIGTSTPANRCEINSAVANTSGLTFTQLTSASPTVANPGTGVLSVGTLGEVIYVASTTSATVGNYCVPTPGLNPLVGSDFEIPLNTFNYRFTGQAIPFDPSATPPNSNVVGIGYACGAAMPAKPSVLQRAGVVTVSTNAGIFVNQDVAFSTPMVFRGAVGSAEGIQAPGNVINMGGDFRALNAETNYGVRGSAVNTGLFNIGVYGRALGGAISSYAGYFEGDLFVDGPMSGTGIVFASDSIFKINVDSISNALSIIKLLKPKQYFLDTANTLGFNFPNQKQYGLVAQQVATVLLELVSNTIKPAEYDTLGAVVHPSITYKSLNYNAFIAILMKGIQEQQTKMDSLSQALEEVISTVNSCCSDRSMQQNNNSNNSIASQDVNLKDEQNIVLETNVPNPFAEQTTINYFLPDNVLKAQMLFYNAQGKLIQSVELIEKGKGSLNVFAQDLSNGIYTYTLVVDGKIFETKKMVKQ